MQNNMSGWEVPVGADLCAEFSPLCLLCTCCYTQHGEVLKLPISLLLRKFPSVQKLSLLHDSPPQSVGLRPEILCLFFFSLFFVLYYSEEIGLPF